MACRVLDLQPDSPTYAALVASVDVETMTELWVTIEAAVEGLFESRELCGLQAMFPNRHFAWKAKQM